MWASPVLPLGHRHAGRDGGFSQTVPTEREAHNCPKCLDILFFY